MTEYMNAHRDIDDPRLAERAAVAAHRRYYAQFVTEQTRREVLARFGQQQLIDAYRQDRHLNTIDLKLWDALCSNYDRLARNESFRVFLAYDRRALALAQGRSPEGKIFISQSDLICIAKEAARQIVVDAESTEAGR